jgi:hypothetical protein
VHLALTLDLSDIKSQAQITGGGVYIEGCSSVNIIAQSCNAATPSWFQYPGSIQAECACAISVSGTTRDFRRAVTNCMIYFSTNNNNDGYTSVSQMVNICSIGVTQGDVHSSSSSTTTTNTGSPVSSTSSTGSSVRTTQTQLPASNAGAGPVEVPVCHVFAEIK